MEDVWKLQKWFCGEVRTGESTTTLYLYTLTSYILLFFRVYTLCQGPVTHHLLRNTLAIHSYRQGSCISHASSVPLPRCCSHIEVLAANQYRKQHSASDKTILKRIKTLITTITKPYITEHSISLAGSIEARIPARNQSSKVQDVAST